MAGDFERVMTSLDYPLFIVTAAARGERSGCLVGFATQTSIKPPRFLACISKKNHTYGVAREADALAVHALTDDERDLAELFGGETADEGVDKFEHVAWQEGPGGAPVLDRSGRWFAGRILDRLDVGDHCGFLLEPIEAEKASGGDDLSFQEGRDIEPGHEP
jgi:flavin reductase (DIM6/NTAB) family NADH-FMN oxidoreductase RutF